MIEKAIQEVFGREPPHIQEYWADRLQAAIKERQEMWPSKRIVPYRPEIRKLLTSYDKHLNKHIKECRL